MVTRALILLRLSAGALSEQSDSVAVLPKGELDLRVQAPPTDPPTSPPVAHALAEVRVAENATSGKALASAAAAEAALSSGKVTSAVFQPDAEALPMACSESLIKTSEISTSSCKEEHGVCVHGPLQSLMDGNYDHAWMPKANTDKEWIQWNWTQPVVIHYIQTSGMRDPATEGALKEYKLEYLTPPPVQKWEYYVDVSDEGRGLSWSVLDGFAAAPDAKMNALNPPIESTSIRIRPTTWKRSIAFRASIRGCNADTVKTGAMTLQAEFRSLFPATFQDLNTLSTELRLQVAEYTGASLDQVQVPYIKADPADELKATIAGIEFLPKPGTGPTGDANTLLNSLAAGLGDTTSTIFQFTSDIVNKAARDNIDSYSCANINCHEPNGECAGGQCFCLEGYDGADCSTITDQARTDLIKGATLGDSAAVTTVNEMDPLPVLAGLPTVTNLEQGKSTPKLTNAEMEDQIGTTAEDFREENLLDEVGYSAIVKQHSILVTVILFLAGCMWTIAVFCTYPNKDYVFGGKDTESSTGGDLPRASLVGDTEE